MNLDAHPFRCNKCAGTRPHILIKTYECQDVPDTPPEVWLVECQGCFEQRIIYPAERLVNREDDISRCDKCGNLKMKAARCRICKMIENNEKVKEKYWNGNTTLEREI